MENKSEYGPWNPGIQSQLPREILPFSTILNPDNVFQSFEEIEELRKFTGLSREQIAAFRPERLATHELLIRISANFSVSDGNQYQDLGFNFRDMAQTLLDKYVQPNMQQVVDCYEELRKKTLVEIERELDQTVFAPRQSTAVNPSWWQKLVKISPPPIRSVSPEIRDANFLKLWQQKADDANNHPLLESVYLQLNKIIGSIVIGHGRIRGEKDILGKLVANRVCNIYGSRLVGKLIEPMILAGAAREGYTKLPNQAEPVIMNVKGSSAAGKSTLRPLQRKLVEDLGLKWEDFALISPDIWRKFLLDYESLGDAYKYAGTCSGHELKIVDQKLDAYMAGKGRNKTVPHLIIDRFRFDSFSEKSRQEGSNLLTRFGSKVYLYYVITPPDATVERAWKRGLQVGRFKAADDLLDHNVEAFTGMPKIFFTWALDKEKDVHYEFLDNSVELGERPRTVAFGRNGTLNVLDIKPMLDIDRYRKINVNAKSAGEVYPTGDVMDAGNNTDFIAACIERLNQVDFVDFNTGDIALRTKSGRLQEWESARLKHAIADSGAFDALLGLFSDSADRLVEDSESLGRVDFLAHQTLGQCGAVNRDKSTME